VLVLGWRGTAAAAAASLPVRLSCALGGAVAAGSGAGAALVAVVVLVGTAAPAAAAAGGCWFHVWYVRPNYVRDKCCDGELQDEAGHQLRRQQQPSQLRHFDSGRAQRPHLRRNSCY
jgi:hypothetical protein